MGCEIPWKWSHIPDGANSFAKGVFENGSLTFQAPSVFLVALHRMDVFDSVLWDCKELRNFQSRRSLGLGLSLKTTPSK